MSKLKTISLKDLNEQKRKLKIVDKDWAQQLAKNCFPDMKEGSALVKIYNVYSGKIKYGETVLEVFTAAEKIIADHNKQVDKIKTIANESDN